MYETKKVEREKKNAIGLEQKYEEFYAKTKRKNCGKGKVVEERERERNKNVIIKKKMPKKKQG